jgi:hypothetical protein
MKKIIIAVVSILVLTGVIVWSVSERQKAAAASNVNRQIGALVSEIGSLNLDWTTAACAPGDQALYGDIVRRRADLEVLVGKKAESLSDVDVLIRQKIVNCRRQQISDIKQKTAALQKELTQRRAEKLAATRRSAAIKKYFHIASSGEMDQKDAAVFDAGLRRLDKLDNEEEEELKLAGEEALVRGWHPGGHSKRLAEIQQEREQVQAQMLAPFYVKK